MITEKVERESDSNMVDRQGDVLVYFYYSTDKKGMVTGRVVFQYGPARVSNLPVKRHSKDAVMSELSKWYNSFLVEHKEGTRSLHYIREVIQDS